MEAFTGLFVGALAVYLAAGAVFAVAFALFGVHRLDPAARGASVGFRLIILPGTIALWPLLAARWIRVPG